MIKNTQNPEFAKVIKMDYRFEEVQKLKFSVYDIDNETDSLDDDDFLGSLECTLGEVRGVVSRAVNNHWTGPVDWTGGLDYKTGNRAHNYYTTKPKTLKTFA